MGFSQKSKFEKKNVVHVPQGRQLLIDSNEAISERETITHACVVKVLFKFKNTRFVLDKPNGRKKVTNEQTRTFVIGKFALSSHKSTRRMSSGKGVSRASIRGILKKRGTASIQITDVT